MGHENTCQLVLEFRLQLAMIFQFIFPIQFVYLVQFQYYQFSVLLE